jgi:hypothetical protein
MPEYGPTPLPSGSHPPNKVFQASRVGKPFKGTLEEEGRRARDFVSRFEITRLATPGLTDAQLVTTAVVHLQNDAESWFFTEDVKFFQAYGVSLADHWEWFKFLFL